MFLMKFFSSGTENRDTVLKEGQSMALVKFHGYVAMTLLHHERDLYYGHQDHYDHHHTTTTDITKK